MQIFMKLFVYLSYKVGLLSNRQPQLSSVPVSVTCACLLLVLLLVVVVFVGVGCGGGGGTFFAGFKKLPWQQLLPKPNHDNAEPGEKLPVTP